MDRCDLACIQVWMTLAIPVFLHNHSAACQRVSIQAIIAPTCIAEYNIFAGEAQTRNGNFDLAPGLGLEPRIFCFKCSCPRRLDDPGVFVDSGRQIRTVDLDLMGVMRTAAPLSRYEAGGAGLEPASIRINSAAHSPGLLPAIECQLATLPRFELGFSDSESDVLPLHHEAMRSGMPELS